MAAPIGFKNTFLRKITKARRVLSAYRNTHRRVVHIAKEAVENAPAARLHLLAEVLAIEHAGKVERPIHVIVLGLEFRRAIDLEAALVVNHRGLGQFRFGALVAVRTLILQLDFLLQAVLQTLERAALRVRRRLAARHASALMRLDRFRAGADELMNELIVGEDYCFRLRDEALALLGLQVRLALD